MKRTNLSITVDINANLCYNVRMTEPTYTLYRGHAQLRDYYTYGYLRIHDDEHGNAMSPYYVGMGRRRRVVSKHKNLSVTILPKSHIVIFEDNIQSRAEAIEAERILIEYYGRVDKGTGCLLNKNAGGGGFENRVSVRDSNGNTMQVSTTDPRYLSGELKFAQTGLVAVIDDNRHVFKVSVDDERYLSGDLRPTGIGMVPVYDANGIAHQVSIDDERYLSGELKFVLSGTVTVKDKNGNTSRVAVDDERYLSGELLPIAAGRVCVRDINNNVLQVNTDDPRYLSGELTAFMKGRKWPKPMSRLVCPHCKLEGGSGSMKRYHFNNCKVIKCHRAM